MEKTFTLTLRFSLGDRVWVVEWFSPANKFISKEAGGSIAGINKSSDLLRNQIIWNVRDSNNRPYIKSVFDSMVFNAHKTATEKADRLNRLISEEISRD